MITKPLVFNIEPSIFAPFNVSVNGTISHAINSYLARNIPLQKLLYDYNAIISTPGLLDEPFNNWKYYCEHKNIPYVCGVSDEEAKFNLEAMSLHSQKPISVIKSICYRNKTLNDSGLERVFLNSINNHIKCAKSILVVNPSPISIELIESIIGNALYAVTDKTLSSLYCKQYKCSRFIDINHSINNSSEVDVLLVFTSPSDEELLSKIMRIVTHVNAKNVFAIMQTRLVDNKKSSLWEAIKHNNYHMCDVVIIPNEITNTVPKKKCFLSMTSGDNDLNTQIHRIDYDPISKSLSLASNVISEPWNTVRDTKLTLNRIWENNTSISSTKEKESLYSKAQLFSFSNEIQISYTLYSNNQRSYIKAYYTETKNPLIPSVRGQALTNRKERNIADPTEDTITSILEELAYIDSFSKVITNDICENYIKKSIPISFKSLWFICRKELSHTTTYNDDLLQEAFSTRSNLCNINVEHTSTGQIGIIIHELFNEGEEIKELTLLKQLNSVIEIAIKNGFISNNHILPLIPAAKNRASKRQAEAMQALVKRNFEPIEENRIIKYLKTHYIESSLHLAVFIRLFTGISVKEVCGLIWSDFIYNENTGVYTLSITKSIGSNGTPISHAFEDNWDKYRVLPLTKSLSDVLLARKAYLIEQGIDETNLLNYPIVLHRETISGMMKGHRIAYCRPSAVYQKCREAIKIADIPQHIIVLPEESGDIETDINSFNGDIYRSNFRDKALNAALLEIDELHYYLGISKPDTYSQYYCDYTNEYVQLIIHNKLNRWGSQHLKQTKHANKKGAIMSKGLNDGVPCIEITLTKDPSTNNDPIIEIESTHGFRIITNPYINGDVK